MRKMAILLLAPCIVFGCGGGDVAESADEAAAPQGVQLVFDAPEPLAEPERKELSSDTDWEAKAHNKEIEVIQVLNIINPVAAYITAGFEKHGDRFGPTLQEEWGDTQEQLTKALSLYESCKKRKADGEFDKQLFLDLEEVWQLLVKTGVAGVRTKSMVDAELRKITT
jgi:hypothetical protein